MDNVEAELVRITETALAPAAPRELTVRELKAQYEKVQELIREVMEEDVDYGVLPGTKSRGLLQPGAEKLGMLFRLRPEFDPPVIERHPADPGSRGGHYTIRIQCSMVGIRTGEVWATYWGACSTKEVKYAYRQAKRKCPACGIEAIIKGRVEYGGGWLCHKKQAGCGAKYGELDEAITGQTVGRVDNEELGDLENTILKMAEKRAHQSCARAALAVSHLFVTDPEEISGQAEPGRPAPTASVVDPDAPMQGEALDVAVAEWVTAFGTVRTLDAHEELRAAIAASPVFKRLRPEHRQELAAARDAAKARLTP